MPNFGSNLSGQFGIANETTVGTAVPVTTFIEVNSANLESRKNTAQGGGLRGPGSGVQRAQRRSLISADGGGDVELYATTKGMGKIVQAMMGSYSTTATVIASTTAYRQIHNVGSPDGHAFTAQVGLPSVDATVNPLTYAGCKVTAWELSCAPNGLLTLKLTVDTMTAGQPTGAGCVGVADRVVHGDDCGVRVQRPARADVLRVHRGCGGVDSDEPRHGACQEPKHQGWAAEEGRPVDQRVRHQAGAARQRLAAPHGSD
jgi:hypothetical protein